MKSITIHGLDKNLSEKISALARENGLSLNKTIKLLLNKALGSPEQDYQNRKNDFEKFLGVWSKEEYSNFTKSIKEFEKVDKSDWK